MRHPALTLGVVASLLLVGVARSQCTPQFTLSSTPPNTGQLGVMFDLEATGNIALKIDSFDIYFTGTSLTYEVWVRPPNQSFVGFQSTTAGWTLIGTVPGFTGLGTTTSVPMNLCLGYILQPGPRTGFYITSQAGGTHWYHSTGVGAVGSVWLTDPRLTLYAGNSGTYFSTTISPRAFGGSVKYSFGENQLSLSQTGPGVGDLTVGLTQISAQATQGYLILSGEVSQAVGTGPIAGVWPDATTWLFLTTTPLQDGNPIHFPVPSAFGGFPNNPFYLGPRSVNVLTGQTLDFACLMLAPGFPYAGKSNTVRLTFQ